MQPINSTSYPHTYYHRQQFDTYASNKNHYPNSNLNFNTPPSTINRQQIFYQYSANNSVNMMNRERPYYQNQPQRIAPQTKYNQTQFYPSSYQQQKPMQFTPFLNEQQKLIQPYQQGNLIRWNDKNESNMKINEQNIIPNVGFSNPAFESQASDASYAQNNRTHQNQNFFRKRFPDPDIRYKILTVMNTKQALDVTSVTDPDKDLRKGDAIIWEYHGGPNQNFYLKPLENNKIKIINAATGFPLKVQDRSQLNGAILKVNPNAQSQNEIFTLIRHQGKYKKQNIYQIETFCGKVLDCKDQHSKNGTNVIQWSSNKGKNQLWLIQPA